MPRPTNEELEAIAERMRLHINENRNPIANVGVEDHNALCELHIHDRTAAHVMLAQLRDHARQRHWPVHRIQHEITFAAYREGASAFRQQLRETERAVNVVRLQAAREARERRTRPRPRPPAVEIASGADAQLLETDSPRLVGIALLKTRRAGRLWYDAFYKRTFSDWNGTSDDARQPAAPIDDALVRHIATWLQLQDVARMARITERQVHNWVLYVASLDVRNAPRDWLETLQWDGQERLSKLLRRGFGADDTRFNQEAGRCWIVSLVARVMEPGCKVDTMPVFIGGQGRLKSQALEVIGGEWYRAASSGIDSKDFLQELHGAWVFEIPELHSLIASRQGSARIKAVLSTRVDHFRLPYGMLPEDHKRTAVPCGTTNNRDWHNDDTGGRRFWPCHIGIVDLDWLRDNREHLFAEAAHYWRARRELIALSEGDGIPDDHPHYYAWERGQWWNVPDDEQTVLIDAETSRDVWRDVIETRLQNEHGFYDGINVATATPWDGSLSESTVWGNTLTNARIAHQWLRLPAEAAGKKANTNRIASIMRALGFDVRQIRMGAGRCRVWVPMCDNGGENRDVNIHVNNEDRDIPF